MRRALTARLTALLGSERVAKARALKRLAESLIDDATLRRPAMRGAWNLGYCPICESATVFVRKWEWLRDSYICLFCRSIPRERALMRILQQHFPTWRELAIHESSPGGSSSSKLARECSRYIGSQFFPDTPPGAMKNGIRSENLEQMSFDDESLDLVVTQDVLEHVLRPVAAFKEIARVLKPNGAHVFTVPYFFWRKTLIRAVDSPAGIVHLQPPDYHRNPVDEKGSLVVTEWGPELIDVIYTNSRMITTIYSCHDVSMGLEAEFLEVFVSVKRAADRSNVDAARGDPD